MDKQSIAEDQLIGESLPRPPTDEERRNLEMARYFWMDQSLARADTKAALLFTGMGVVAASFGVMVFLAPVGLHATRSIIEVRDAAILTMLAMLATLAAALPNWRGRLNLSSPSEIGKALEGGVRFKRWSLYVAFVTFAAAVALVIAAFAESGRLV